MQNKMIALGEISPARRRLLIGAAVAGLGALLASEVVASNRTSTEPLSDDVKLQHLLRRAGFGAGPGELDHYGQLGLSGTVDQLINFESIDNSSLDQRLQGLKLNVTKRFSLERWWLLRMIYTARPLEEKMTLFWHGLLTSAISKVGKAELMYAQNEYFRQNVFGKYPDILKGISRDPAMMIWLDLETNRKGHANENFARELMELFSLGVGNYTEQDVRESARAFTGWSLRQHRFFFNQRLHDDGSKTFLGQTGNFDGNDIIDIIVKQPASAAFVTRKFFEYFVYPNPTEAVLKPFVDSYTSSGYSIKSLMKSLLTSDEFYSPPAYRSLVKSPAEFIAGTIRTLGIDFNGLGLPQAAIQMGQELFNPPNVAGWPGGPTWLNTGTWLARLNFANRVTVGVTQQAVSRQALSTLARTRQQQLRAPGQSGGFDMTGLLTGTASPSNVVDRLLGILVDGQINPTQRQVLIDYVTPPNGATATNAWRLERYRGALYLAMALPEFHLS